MKKTLLATVAAAALFAGTGLAMAEGAAKDQGNQGGARSGAAEMNKSGGEAKGGAEQKGGAEMKKSGADAKSKAQTTGQGAGMDTKADGKAGADTKSSGQAQKSGQAEQKAGEQKSQAQSKEAPAANKTQAQDNKQAPSGSQAQDQRQAPANRNQAQENRQQQPGARPSAQDSTRPGATTGQGTAGSTQAGGAVNLTTEQKTTIRSSVIQSSSAPKIQRSQVNFNIGVGTVVPRNINVVEVPDTIIRIHPAWRGFRYFIVDEQIVIVEPGSLKIVAVLDV